MYCQSCGHNNDNHTDCCRKCNAVLQTPKKTKLLYSDSLVIFTCAVLCQLILFIFLKISVNISGTYASAGKTADEYGCVIEFSRNGACLLRRDCADISGEYKYTDGKYIIALTGNDCSAAVFVAKKLNGGLYLNGCGFENERFEKIT